MGVCIYPMTQCLMCSKYCDHPSVPSCSTWLRPVGGASRSYWMLPLIFLKKVLFIYLFLETGREGERDRNINVWLPLMRPLLGTWPTTQACALTGSGTGNRQPFGLQVGTQTLSYTSQGTSLHFYVEFHLSPKFSAELGKGITWIKVKTLDTIFSNSIFRLKAFYCIWLLLKIFAVKKDGYILHQGHKQTCLEQKNEVCFPSLLKTFSADYFKI